MYLDLAVAKTTVANCPLLALEVTHHCLAEATVSVLELEVIRDCLTEATVPVLQLELIQNCLTEATVPALQLEVIQDCLAEAALAKHCQAKMAARRFVAYPIDREVQKSEDHQAGSARLQCSQVTWLLDYLGPPVRLQVVCR